MLSTGIDSNYPGRTTWRYQIGLLWERLSQQWSGCSASYRLSPWRLAHVCTLLILIRDGQTSLRQHSCAVWDWSLKPGTHWRQSWILHGRLCWKSTVAVADTGNKSATKSTVTVYVKLCCHFSQQIGNNVDSRACRSRLPLPTCSTLLPIRSTLLPLWPKPHSRICRLSTELTVLNSTLSPVCIGL